MWSVLCPAALYCAGQVGQLLEAEAELQTQEGEVAAMGLQMQELSAKCGGGAPSKAELGEKVPGMSIDVEALGKLLSQHGVAQEQCPQLAGALAVAIPHAMRQSAKSSLSVYRRS